MKLNKIAVGVALAAGAMSAAHADSIFFPYVVKGGSVTTVINVIDSATAAEYYDASGNIGGNRLHYTLVNKNGNAALDNTATCGEVNYYLPHSPFDLQSIDLGAQFSAAADKGILFNDPGVNNAWRPAVSGALTYAMAQAAGAGAAVRGYLLVDNARTAGPQSLSGEAMVFEFGGGAAWGYRAYANATNAGLDNTADEFNYGEIANLGDDVLGAGVNGNAVQVSFMPLAETTTRFFVTPLNRVETAPGIDGTATALVSTANDQMHPFAAAAGSYRTQVIMQAGGGGVAYDRDENLVSGAVPQNVTCVGAVDVPSLLSTGAAATLVNGGWGNLMARYPGGVAPSSTNLTDTRRASVIKLEFNAGGVFNGVPTTGTYNNAFEL